MMDLHLIIVIACVVLASLGSLLFINKFFRRKTFEEIIAEKKAMTEKMYAQNKVTGKKPKKQQQQLKKEQKREKKQRQREQKENNNEEESDAQSEQQSPQDDDSNGLSKLHVEFEPDPEVMTFDQTETKPLQQKTNNADKENVLAIKSKPKKEKKSNKPAIGILVNKNEPVAVKETVQNEEQSMQLNHFDVKVPKDVVEMKKQDKETVHKKEEKSPNLTSQQQKKNAKKDKPAVAVNNTEQQAAAEAPIVAKEIKQQEEKARHGSPKLQHNGNAANSNNANTNTATKNKQLQKKQKDVAATKELVQSIDKLASNDTISVNLLMNLFRRAELNRSEIQILIDYLLNKQQDMPSTHAEWSDDICQKLRRQLQEKEKALAEEQEASAGIQAKLRELRAEVNTERIQMNATAKAYADKMAAKEQEIAAINQEMQNLNEKFNIERQQFQAKLMHEKQAGSQELLTQLQLMQNELALKDKCVAELTHMVNASRQAVEESAQKNDIIQQQQQQIVVLEQQREELEQLSNNRIFEMEKLKTLETENGDYKVEICNLQNALESSKADLAQAVQELEAQKHNLASVRNNELLEKQNEIDSLNAKLQELSQQLYNYNSMALEQSKEQSSLQVALDKMQQHLFEKEQELTQVNSKNTDLLQQIARWVAENQQQKQQLQSAQELMERLKAEIADKHTKLQDATQHVDQFSSREKDLLQQLHDQKEKNNDLRMKNWKLVEALQNAETTILKQNKTFNSASSANENLVEQEQLLIAAQKPVALTSISTNTEKFSAPSIATSTTSKGQEHMRELFGRLYPDAVKACASSALTESFDQWVEQVLTTHIKQTVSKDASSSSRSSNNTTTTTSTATTTISSSNKSTQSNSNHYDTNITNHNTNNNNNNHTDIANATNKNGNGRLNTSSSSDSSNYSSSGGQTAATDAEMQRLNKQNLQLRAQIDELTKLVKKTSNTLSDIEERAREQDEHWRSVVRSKDELIYSLKHSNGEQDI